MNSTLVALHGFTQNGAQLRAHLEELSAGFPSGVDLVCPDAPHPCTTESVDRLHSFSGAQRADPPYLCWWDASSDGSVYHGLEDTLSQVRTLLEERPGAGVLGFSQGAILAASIAALSHHEQLPRIAFVILVAGRVPRAHTLRTLFEAPIRVPSLHVWGDRDPFASNSPALADCFDASTRETCVWPGSHVLPTRGLGALAILEFVRRHA